MGRNTWSVEKLNGTWANDGTIYRPNENVGLNLNATQSKVKLANGDVAYITAETKYNQEPIVFRWLDLAESDSMIDKVRNYVINQDYLRITDHNSDTYTGRFIYIQRVWLSGVEDTYDIEVGFERMA